MIRIAALLSRFALLPVVPLLPVFIGLIGLIGVLGLAGCGGSSPAAGAPAEPATSAEGNGLVILPPETIGVLPDGTPPRPYFHDFGNVLYGTTVSHAFRLENTDSVPIGIKRITPSCGCTVPALRYTDADGQVVTSAALTSTADTLISIPPGVVAELDLAIETIEIRQTNTHKLLTVNLTTDAPKSYYLTLEAHIFVERPFNVVPEGIHLGRFPANGETRKSAQIVRAGTFQWRVKELLEVPDGVHAELTSSVHLGRDIWTLTAGFEPPQELGRRSAILRVSTETENGEPRGPIKIILSGDAVPDLQSEPSRLVLSTRRDASAVLQATVYTLLPGHRFRVEDTRVSPEHADLFSVETAPLEESSDGASATWSVVLATRTALPETDVIRGDVVLTLDDVQHPEVRVPYVIHVEGE